MHTLKYDRNTRHDLLVADRLSMARATRVRGPLDRCTEPPVRRRRAGVAVPFADARREEGIATYVLLLRDGQEIVSTVLEFAREERLVSGSLKAIGAVRDAQIACFDAATREYGQVEVREPAEVASLVGAFGLANGQPLLHIHAALRPRDGSARAGHLLKAHVFSTLEITLTAWSRPLRRARDVEAGLKSLRLAS